MPCAPPPRRDGRASGPTPRAARRVDRASPSRRIEDRGSRPAPNSLENPGDRGLVSALLILESMSFSLVTRGAVVAAGLACALGCGRIEYGESTTEVVEVRTGGGTYLVQDPPNVEYRAHVVPAPNPQPPAYAAPQPPPPQPPPAFQPEPGRPGPPGTIRCAGNEQIRVDDEVIDGRGGPAIVASGNCVVEVTESIVRGAPAVVVTGNARVRLVESRVQGFSGRGRHGHRGWRGHRRRARWGDAPAVVASGNGQAEILECRVRGDLVSSGAGQIGTRGIAHRGHVLRGAF